MYNSVYLRLLIVLFCVTSHVRAQTEIILASEKKNAVVDLLDTFEKEHGILFSYNNDDLRDVTIVLDELQLSVKRFSEFLYSQTYYELKYISRTNYIVKKQNTIRICGTITNTFNNAPLIGVNVFVPDTDIGAISGVNGEFSLSVNVYEQSNVTVQNIGYTTQVLAISRFKNGECLAIPLAEKAEQLSEVIISDYLTLGVVKNSDGSVSVSPKSLKILPGLIEPDVMQSVQLLPGINSPNENATGLYIRGSSSDHNLVLFDHIKMYHVGHLFDQISVFNPYITENVQVFRSGTSARYGDRVSGVIDIKTATEIPKETSGGFGVNLLNADAFLKFPIHKKVGMILSTRRSITDLYESETYETIIQRVFQVEDFLQDPGAQLPFSLENTSYFSDYSAKLIVDFNAKSKMQISGLHVANDITKVKTIPFRTNFEEIEKGVRKIANSGGSISWDLKHNDYFSLHSNVHVSDYTINVESTKIPNREVNSDSFTQTVNRLEQNQLVDLGSELSFKYNFKDKHSLYAGYQFTHYNVKIGNLNAVITSDFNETFGNKELFDGRLNMHTLFSEYQFKNKKRLITLGTRVSQLSRINTIYVEPRLFFSYQIAKHHRLTLSGEIKNQVINQLYFSPGQASVGSRLNTWTLANKEKDDEGFSTRASSPIRNYQGTFGWLYSNKGWNFDIESYYKKLEGLTTYGDHFRAEKFYTGEGTIVGLDILLKKRIRNYRMWLSYSWSLSKIRFPEFRANSFLSAADKPHILNWSQTLELGKFQVAAGFSYASGRPYSAIVSEVFEGDSKNISYDVRGVNNERLPDYLRIDTSLTYRFSWGKSANHKALLGVSFLNVLNRKSQINADSEFTTIPYEGFLPTGSSATGLYPFVKEENSLQFLPNLVFRLNF